MRLNLRAALGRRVRAQPDGDGFVDNREGIALKKVLEECAG
jgi:hypothetical protein